MKRDKTDKKILDKLMSSPKIKTMHPQSVTNAISKIHTDNHGITMNAAAYIFAKKIGIKVNRYLKPGDKAGLAQLRAISMNHTNTGMKVKKFGKFKQPRTDFENSFSHEASLNVSAYFYVYILENSLRNIIFNEFGTGKEWWSDKTIVLQGIQDYAQRIEEAEKKYPWLKKRSDHPLFYVGLFELYKIIENNWPKFKKFFRDLEQLRAWIKESVPIRNLVAHSIKIRNMERERIRTNTDYICRLIQTREK